MKQFFVALVFLGVPALAASLGYAQGVEGARHLYLFWVWAQLVMSMIVCAVFVVAGEKLDQAENDSKEKSSFEQLTMKFFFVPMLAVSVLLPAWYGAWVLAVVYGAGWLFLGYGVQQLNSGKQVQLPQGWFLAVFLTIAWIGSVWAGCIQGQEGARNIVFCGVSLGFCRAALALAFKAMKLKTENETETPVSAVQKLIIAGRESAVLVMFVWQGAWILVAALIARWLLQYSLVLLDQYRQAQAAEFSQTMNKLSEMRAMLDARRR